MDIQKLVIDIITTFVLAFVVVVVVTYLWGLIFQGAAAVDWGTSFRLAIMLGIILPVHRTMIGKGK